MLDETSGGVLSGNRWPGLKSLTEAVGIRPLVRQQSLDLWQTIEKGSCPCAALTYDHVETWGPPIIYRQSQHRVAYMRPSNTPRDIKPLDKNEGPGRLIWRTEVCLNLKLIAPSSVWLYLSRIFFRGPPRICQRLSEGGLFVAYWQQGGCNKMSLRLFSDEI